MTFEEIALQIFCAMLHAGLKVSTGGDSLGKQQIETAFALATTFTEVAAARPNRPTPT